jgi:hypothetical protein
MRVNYFSLELTMFLVYLVYLVYLHKPLTRKFDRLTVIRTSHANLYIYIYYTTIPWKKNNNHTT